MKDKTNLKIFKNKKALMAEAGFWVLRIIVLIGSIIALVAMKNIAMSKLTSTHDLEYKILVNRLIYSPTAFAYIDASTGRSYPGVINLDNFNEKQLNNSLKTQKTLALRLILDAEGVFKEIYYDKEEYDFQLPLTVFEQHKRINQTRLVVVDDNGKRIPGHLYIEMIYVG